MATIQCKTEIPKVEGLKDGEITVGREFLLICEGEFPKNLVQEKLHFVLKPEEKYAIKLLNFEFRTSSEADLKITSYKAGQFQFQDLQLTDGEQTLSLGPVQYAVQTVIEAPPQGVQQKAKQEPYGPIGPATVGVPALYWAILAGVISLFVMLVLAKMYRVVQRRNMLARLKEHDSALSPIAQFHQTLRRLQRTNTVFFGGDVKAEDVVPCVETVYQSLKMYLTRRYQIPALEWNDRLILQDLKKYHRKVYAEFAAELKQLLKEFAQANKDKTKVTASDALNLATHCRILVEKMERVA